MNSKVEGNISQSKKVALTAVMSAMIAVTTVLAIPLPPPLSTINLAPVIIFATSILLGPSVGITSTAIGCGLGYLTGTSVGTISVPAGLLYIYWIGLIVARSPMALVVGLLRKKSQITGMVIGVVIETLIFFSIDLFVLGIAIAVFDFGTLVDLVSVPVTLTVLVAVRRVFNIKYLA